MFVSGVTSSSVLACEVSFFRSSGRLFAIMTQASSKPFFFPFFSSSSVFFPCYVFSAMALPTATPFAFLLVLWLEFFKSLVEFVCPPAFPFPTLPIFLVNKNMIINYKC